MGSSIRSFLLTLVVVHADHVINVLQMPDSRSKLISLILDEKSRYLFIGAVNHVYEVKMDDMKLTADLNTGPVMDSPFCNWDGHCIELHTSGNIDESEGQSILGNNKTKRLTDNINKILLIYNDQLIICGTILQGTCQLRNLNDITAKSPPSNTPKMPVCSNAANASTVAFIGDSEKEKLLFVAATHTSDPYRDAFPSVSTRSLRKENLFDLFDRGSIEGESAVFIRAEFRTSYLIDYVAGFQHEHFAYWSARQRRSPTVSRVDDPLVSKLIRVCVGDKKWQYVSYSEVEMQCRGANNDNYNLLRAMTIVTLGETARSFMEPPANDNERFIVSLFEKAADSDQKNPSGHSAVCIYPMSKVRMTFWYNVDRCRSGSGSYSMPHIGRDRPCPNMAHRALSEDTCAFGVGGSIELDGVALIEYANARLTSVVVDIIDNESVLIIGTNDGRLKKLMLIDDRHAREYADLQLSAIRAPIAQKMLIYDRHLFVMAGSQLFKVRTSFCSQHRNCSSCLRNIDPYCGWCVLSNKCCVRGECPTTNSTQSRLEFVANSEMSPFCPRLLGQLSPQNASIFESPQMPIRMEIAHIPIAEPKNDYHCTFGQSAKTSARFELPNMVFCRLPSFDHRPIISDDSDDYVQLTLGIFSEKTGVTFFEQPFIFFDCGAHRLCTTCSASKWKCQWCLMNNRCVHSTAFCSDSNTIKSRFQCPRIDMKALPKNGLLLADNHDSSIQLPAVNLNLIFDQFSPNSPVSPTDLECSLIIEGRQRVVVGKLNDKNWVECQSRVYNYKEDQPTLKVDLFLTAGGNFVIDKITVTLYKCPLLRGDCSRCLTLDSIYQCTWCGGGCNFRHFCPLNSIPDTIDANTVCNHPIIESLEPTSGPIEGGTRLVIEGRDLGTRMDDVIDRVVIGNVVQCRVVDYRTSTHIVCITGPGQSTTGGPVEIALGLEHQRIVRSSVDFYYVDPNLSSIYPSYGPMAGGTRLTIHGVHLNAGRTRKILIGSVPCLLLDDESTSNQLVCVTFPVKKPVEFDTITLTVDESNRTLSTRFSYRENPDIISIEPMVTFRSGGRNLLIKGKNLDSVLIPKIYLIDPIKRREKGSFSREKSFPPSSDNDNDILASEMADCQAKSSTTMQCFGPKMKSTIRIGGDSAYSQDPNDYAVWPVGFSMDGVESVRDFTDQFHLTVVPDPEFFPFSNAFRTHRPNSPLIIDGQYLSLAATIADVQVFVGDYRCNATILSNDRLVCTISWKFPITGRRHSLVVILVGSLRFELGILESLLEDEGRTVIGNEGIDPTILAAGTAIGMTSLITAILVVLAMFWKRRSCETEKDYKRIQLQMDTLESNVRQECKQAFTELQTDMTYLTSDLVSLGIPFHDRRKFAINLLFNNEHRQQSLFTAKKQWQPSPTIGNGYSSHLHIALAQFESLLWNRQFVLTIIDTWQRQSSFDYRDSVYVASLLTVTLTRNMQYLAELVLMLLNREIEMGVVSNEGLSTKLLNNWLALCLYDYLRENKAGESLFLLYQALKHQMDKGPVDAVTEQAKYSLSEDRLLKENVQTGMLQIFVLSLEDGRPDSNEMFPCRVLNCDTVSQVKRKILDVLYRNTPFSLRPTIQDVDLEWRCPTKRPVTLTDDDQPNSKGTLKRLNTFTHYGIPNNALMAIKPRHSGSFTYQSSSSQTYSSLSSSTQLICQSSSETNIRNEQKRGRYFHLTSPNCSKEHRKKRQKCQKRHKMDTDTDLQKILPEIYLTRMLTSKGTVHNFVDDFFQSAFRVTADDFPPVVKYLFDFIDGKVGERRNRDVSLLHSWKSRIYPLSLWHPLLLNPNILFDIDSPCAPVSASLSVLARVLIDSSSIPHFDVESLSNNMLFAKDLPRYRRMVNSFRERVTDLASISTDEFDQSMANMSKKYSQQLDVLSSVRELLAYTVKYSDCLLSSLSHNEHAMKYRLAERLENVLISIGGPGTYSDAVDHIYATVT